MKVMRTKIQLIYYLFFYTFNTKLYKTVAIELVTATGSSFQ